MTIVNLKGQRLDLKSKCHHADLAIEKEEVKIYFCNQCGQECEVLVSEGDEWSNTKSNENRLKDYNAVVVT